MKGRQTFKAIIFESILFIWLIPFVWTFTQSLGHYKSLCENEIFISGFVNSVFIALGTGLFTVGLASWTAYWISRKLFPYKRSLLACAAVVSMYPQLAASGPLFLAFRELHLINTRYALIITYSTFSMPLILWFLYEFFRKIPREFDEAAALDGAGDWIIFLKIIVPQSYGGLVTAFSLTFLYVWNEFFFGLVFTIDERSQPLSKILALFTSRYETAWGDLSAAAVIAAVPVLVLSALAKYTFFSSND